MGQFNEYQAVPLEAKDLDKLPEDMKKQAKLAGNMLYLSNDAKKGSPDPEKAAVGDFCGSASRRSGPATVSVMARQVGDTFEPWQSSTNTTVANRLMPGTVVIPPTRMVGEMEGENNDVHAHPPRRWLRVNGFRHRPLVFSPLAVLADVVPLLGDLLRMGVGLFAALIAAVLWLITIAVAWFVYRPMLGIGLCAIAVALVVGLKMLGSKKTT